MKNEKKYLAIYERWIDRGRMDYGGICATFVQGSIFPEFQLLEPNSIETLDLIQDGYSHVYWGSGSRDYMTFHFTPLRQNIVLLMAALNNEL